MTAYAATQIPKPKDAKTFERCSVTLWRCILSDPHVKLLGRSGQEQHGVDLIGNRNGDPEQIVGVQCKCKGDGKTLSQDEVKKEVQKALKFTPPLSEYIVVTTAPDDQVLDRLARELSISASRGRSKNLNVQVYGWGSLEDEIRRYPEAQKAFDPSHSPQGDQVIRGQEELSAKLDHTNALLATVLTPSKVSYDGTAGSPNDVAGVHPVLDRQIDNLVTLMKNDPNTALTAFRNLHEALEDDVSDRIRFRVVSNIAACHLRLGDEDTAAQGFIEAYDLDPDNPKSVANKAIGLHLQGDWLALKSFAEPRLKQFADSADLAAIYVRGSVADHSTNDPLSHLPAAVLGTREVDAAHVQWLMNRGAHGAWWDAAIKAYETHSRDDVLDEVYACALLDRTLDGNGLFYGQPLDKDSDADISTAVAVLEERWRELLDNPTYIDPQSLSVPHNLMVGYQLQHDTAKAVEVGIRALEHFPDEVAIRSFTVLGLLAQGDVDRARSLASGLELCPQTISVLLDVAVATEAWRDVFDLVDNHLDDFRE